MTYPADQPAAIRRLGGDVARARATGMPQGQDKTGDLVDGRFRLAGHLGAGGMGTVWRADNETSRRRASAVYRSN
ncbi:hypothetical protein ACIOHS_34590 [Streptomyces sp. NPDC088253]|uniref:hypothetical protein n=1 Tax=Streptomyces sp. NPDC088253 TaxID=3365846 RepID=UPI0037F1ED0B